MKPFIEVTRMPEQAKTLVQTKGISLVIESGFMRNDHTRIKLVDGEWLSVRESYREIMGAIDATDD